MFHMLEVEMFSVSEEYIHVAVNGDSKLSQ